MRAINELLLSVSIGTFIILFLGFNVTSSEPEVIYPGSDCTLALRTADSSTSPPAGDGRQIPLPIDPRIPSSSKCRGACGSDCPSTCKSKPDIKICVEDQSGKFHEYWKYTGVIECGSAEGCRIHDKCYDECANDPSPAMCRRVCDKDCTDKYDVEACASWMTGEGDFDSYILYSNPPASEGGFDAGPCPSCCPDISGAWSGYLKVTKAPENYPITTEMGRPVQGDKFVVEQDQCDITLKFDKNQISGKMAGGIATLKENPKGTLAEAILKLESGKLVVLLNQVTSKGAIITSEGTLSKSTTTA